MHNSWPSIIFTLSAQCWIAHSQSKNQEGENRLKSISRQTLSFGSSFSHALSLSLALLLSLARALSLSLHSLILSNSLHLSLAHSLTLFLSLSCSRSLLFVRNDVAQQLEHLVLELLRWYTAVCRLKPNIALDLKVIRIENSALNLIPTVCRNHRYERGRTPTTTTPKRCTIFPPAFSPAHFGLIFTSSLLD